MTLVWSSQVVIGLVMVALGVFLFKKYPLKLETKTMTTVALLMVIAVLLGSFAKIELPLLGPNSFEIKFDTLPILFIGILFGPSWGFVAGFMIDMIQLLFAPTAFPYLGFTLNLMLTGAFAGLMFHPQREMKSLRMYSIMTQIILLALTFVSITLLWVVPTIRVSAEMIDLSFQTQVMVSIALFVVGMGLMAISSTVLRSQFSLRFVRLLIICEVIIQMILTSLWLWILFDIPFVISLIPRIIEGIFMILVLHALGLTLAKGLFNKQLFRR